MGKEMGQVCMKTSPGKGEQVPGDEEEYKEPDVIWKGETKRAAWFRSRPWGRRICFCCSIPTDNRVLCLPVGTILERVQYGNGYFSDEPDVWGEWVRVRVVHMPAGKETRYKEDLYKGQETYVREEDMDIENWAGSKSRAAAQPTG